jgi:hypothetical protein
MLSDRSTTDFSAPILQFRMLDGRSEMFAGAGSRLHQETIADVDAVLQENPIVIVCRSEL